MTNIVYPWSAVVGQAALKRALLLCAIDPGIGGVLVQGPRGVAKTTLARSLGELLPGNFVELPLGATEERVTGTLDLQSALRDGRVQFAPGLLSRAHDGVLYVDEINLLPDTLVDVLLDAAATGQNVVERDGVSHSHAARFVLIGTMNPEEGALRPQLIDRFGLSVNADSEIKPRERAEIVARRIDFDRDPAAFAARFATSQAELIERCQRARELALKIALVGSALERVTERCYAAGVEGVRADIAMLRAARAHAAWHARSEITASDVDAVAELALAHRRRAGRSEPPKSGTPPAADGGGPAGPSDTDDVEGDWGASASQCVCEPADGDQPQPRSDPNADWGALPAQPVRAASAPELPRWLTATRGQRAEARRRGASQLTAARGVRARTRAERGTIDWFATLVCARQPTRGDLRYRARRAPVEQLWIVAIDCSSSMLRGGALAAAKGVAHALQASAVAVGAQLALISFRGPSAHIEVTSSAGRFALDRAIAELAAGGGTPLRTAALMALQLCEQRHYRSHSVAKKMVLLTDGRTRERLDDLDVTRPNLEWLIIDCERSRLRLGRAPALAAALGGQCLHVDSLR